MTMLLLLEDDLGCLTKPELRYSVGGGGGYVYYLEGRTATTFEYWKCQLTSDLISRMASRLKDKELLALVAIAKHVIALGTKCKHLSGDEMVKIITSIEIAHIARFDRKLMYAKANPQLLLEAKADLRDKKSATAE